MEENLVSIVVPVYNVEKYIARCLDSLTAQSYKRLQILVVNDGTEDNSMSIVSEYAMKDSRIEIYNKENGGLSDARNYALSYVRGQYICFVDSDDWVETNYVKLLLNQFEKDREIDISIVDFDYAFDDKSVNREYKLEDVVLEAKESIKQLCNGKEITNHVWNKMYRKDLFQTIRFEKGRKFEDIYIMHQLFDLARKVSCSSNVAYHYYMRNSSILHENSPQNDMDIFIGYRCRYEYFSNSELKIIVLKFCAWSCYKVLYLHEHSKINKNDMDEALIFWKEHDEISKLGIKYLIMYRMPRIYRILVRRGIL